MRGKFHGDRLRLLRKERREDQAAAGAVIDRDRSFISKLEKGEGTPSLETLLAIAKHYDVSPDYLLGWSEKRLPSQSGEPLESENERAFLAAFVRLPDDVRRGIEQVVLGVRVPAVTTRTRKRNNAT